MGPSFWQTHRRHRGFGTATGPNILFTVVARVFAVVRLAAGRTVAPSFEIFLGLLASHEVLHAMQHHLACAPGVGLSAGWPLAG